MDKYKSWILKLVIVAVILSPVVIAPMYFNYYIDPLWNFNHSNEWNDYQVGFDERQQKTNYIIHHPFEYDSLVIGTSRVTYMDQTQFQNNNVYNYSLSDLHIDEYVPYIEFAKKRKRNEFDRIYIELYFGSFSVSTVKFNEPNTYFDIALNPLYRYSTLFSYNTLMYSLENKKYSEANFFEGFRSYNRNNVATTSYINKNIDALMNGYQEFFERKKQNIVYDHRYKGKLIQLKMLNPNSQIIIFADPIPKARLRAMINDPEYFSLLKTWYKDMTEVFGQVYSFQLINEYTGNNNYWFDAFHYYPNFGDKMIANLEGREHDEAFMMIVTEDNLEEYFSLLQNQAK